MPTIYFDQTHLSHSLQFVPDPPLHHPPNFMFSFYVPLSPISVGFKCMGVGPFSGATFLGVTSLVKTDSYVSGSSQLSDAPQLGMGVYVPIQIHSGVLTGFLCR